MRVEWYGSSAFALTWPQATVFVDPSGDLSGLAARGMRFDHPPIAGVEADLPLAGGASAVGTAGAHSPRRVWRIFPSMRGQFATILLVDAPPPPCVWARPAPSTSRSVTCGSRGTGRRTTCPDAGGPPAGRRIAVT